MKTHLWSKKTLFITICTLSVLGFCNKPAQAKPSDNYSADKAVAYADSCFKKKGNSYKKNPNKKYGEELCAGYVSQCLKEGGMTMDSTWKWKRKGKTTKAWRLSKRLFSYLKESGYKVTHSPNASDIQKGDVIFYWTNGGWGHVAICVGKTKTGKPMVNAYNDPHYHFSYWTMGYKTCLISLNTKTATPDITQTVVNGGKKISISCNTPNATIYYTTNGKTPTKASKKYTGSFKLSTNANVKAIATYSNYRKSSVATEIVDVNKTIDNGIYCLNTTSASKMSLGINNASKLEKASLSLLNSNAEYNRKFSVKYLGNGNYSFTLLHSGYALSESLNTGSKTNPLFSKCAGSGSNTGTVVQTKFSSNNFQKWKVTYAKKGCYYITNAQSSDYLSVGSNLRAGITAYTTKTKEPAGQTWNLQTTSRSKLKLKKCVSPSKVRAGRKLTLKGTISSNYKIVSIQMRVINSKGKTVSYASVVPNRTNYSLNKLSSKIKVSKLSAGIYTLRITAYDTSKQVKTLLYKKIKVK